MPTHISLPSLQCEAEELAKSKNYRRQTVDDQDDEMWDEIPQESATETVSKGIALWQLLPLIISIVGHSYLKYLSIMEHFTDLFFFCLNDIGCLVMFLLQKEVTITGADKFPAVSNMLPAVYACTDTIRKCIKFRQQHDCEMADNSACFRIPMVKGKCWDDWILNRKYIFHIRKLISIEEKCFFTKGIICRKVAKVCLTIGRLPRNLNY